MSGKVKSSFSILILLAGLSLLALAPYGGCACNNPLTPSDGPTPTPTPTLGPLICNFENTSNGNVRTPFGGLVATSFDANTGTHKSSGTFPLSAGAPLGSTPTQGMEFVGTVGQDGPPYPWAQLTFPFSAGTVPLPPAFIGSYQGVKFWFKTNSLPPYAAPNFRVNFTDSVITEGGATYQYNFSEPDTAWHLVTVYFPGMGGPAFFAQPGWSVSPKTWGAPNNVRYGLTALQFQAFPSLSGAWNFDFQIDDVTFF